MRRNAAARAAQTEASDADQQDGKAAAAAEATVGGKGQAAAGRTQPRQRRRQERRQAAPQAPAPQEEEEEDQLVDPVDSMSWLQYYPRQYGGVSLGVTAVASTMVCYDQTDPLRVWKLFAWMVLAFVALAVHELRPFKRMNYGDRAREQGLGVRSVFGI